jgi:hypothetical protein
MEELKKSIMNSIELYEKSIKRAKKLNHWENCATLQIKIDELIGVMAEILRIEEK